MRIRIRHSIRYDYTEPVYLEPHLLRMSPRSDVRQRIIEHAVHISPAPRGRNFGLDLDGNQFALAWFEGVHESLDFTADTLVETVPVNPFDYIITAPACAVVPVKYPDVYEKSSARYRERTNPSSDVTEYAWSVAEAAGLDASGFLLRLAQTMSRDFDRVERETGSARDPAETLKTRFGACRDLAALYVDACRSLRMAAQFVSGYVYDSGSTNPQLHAWAEVFLPGPGWRGFDPSYGLAETESYVNCASAASLVEASPVRGAFQGANAESTMKTAVEVTLAD